MGVCVNFVCGIERLAATFHIRVDDGSSSVCCLLNMLEEWCDEEKCSLDFIFSKSISKAAWSRDENRHIFASNERLFQVFLEDCRSC